VRYLVEMRVEAPTIDEASDFVAAMLTTSDADSDVVTSVVVRGSRFHPALGEAEAP
jgi:hypothetical protein